MELYVYVGDWERLKILRKLAFPFEFHVFILYNEIMFCNMYYYEYK